MWAIDGAIMTDEEIVYKLIEIGVKAFLKNQKKYAIAHSDPQIRSLGNAVIASWLEELGKLRIVGDVQPTFEGGMGFAYKVTQEIVDLYENKYELAMRVAPLLKNTTNNTTKILFLSANPSDQARIQTDKEHRIIKSEMERGRHRNFFEFLPSQFAVTITELLRAMNDKPNIIHFSGHGETEGISISTEDNKTQLVPVRALKRLFTPLKDITKIVLLNSCYSAEQAQVISEYGMFVIGMNLPVEDEAAISFAKGLYNGLSEGKTIEAAYNDAMIVLEVEKPDYAEIVEAWKNGKKLDL